MTGLDWAGLRRGLRGERGFTLVELLAVMLILGILAALAIPTFFGQTDKAHDADAKQAVGTAKTAIEVIGKEAGSYSGITAADLVEEEPALTGADLSEPATTSDTYTVEVTSPTGQWFSISRTSAGALLYDCAPRETGGCPADGNWGN